MTAAITTFHPPLSQPGFRLFDGPLRDVADVSAAKSAWWACRAIGHIPAV